MLPLAGHGSQAICRNYEWRHSRAVQVWVSLVLERKHLCTAAEGLELNCSLQPKIPARVCKAPWQRYLGTGAAKRSSQLGPAALSMGSNNQTSLLIFLGSYIHCICWHGCHHLSHSSSGSVSVHLDERQIELPACFMDTDEIQCILSSIPRKLAAGGWIQDPLVIG